MPCHASPVICRLWYLSGFSRVAEITGCLSFCVYIERRFIRIIHRLWSDKYSHAKLCTESPRNQKLLITPAWISQLVFSKFWNSEELGFNSSEGMVMLEGQEQASKEQKVSSSMPSLKLPAEGDSQINLVSSCLKIHIPYQCPSYMCLPTSKVWTRSRFTCFKKEKKTLTGMPSISILFIWDVVKLTT